jgi:hypothetical protein
MGQMRMAEDGGGQRQHDFFIPVIRYTDGKIPVKYGISRKRLEAHQIIFVSGCFYHFHFRFFDNHCRFRYLGVKYKFFLKCVWNAHTYFLHVHWNLLEERKLLWVEALILEACKWSSLKPFNWHQRSAMHLKGWQCDLFGRSIAWNSFFWWSMKWPHVSGVERKKNPSVVQPDDTAVLCWINA